MIVTRFFERIWRGVSQKVRAFWQEDNAPKKHQRNGEEAMLLVPISAARSKWVFCLFFLLLVGVGFKAFWLQCGISTDFLKKQGEARYARTLPVPAQRGQILDRNGVVLASTIPARSVWADPEDAIRLTSAQYEKLAQVLDLDPEKIRGRIEARKDKNFVYIDRQIEVEKGEEVRNLQLPGIYVTNEVRRNYPDGEISAHVVGFTDSDNNGREGVELANNSILAGKQGSRRVIRDRLGRIVEDVWVKEGEVGSDVVLSIDSRLQFIAHNALAKAIERHQAKAGAVVVVDVHTGEILAMSNWPTYDPNARRSVRFENIRNRVLTDTFEPGSTMKPFAIAKALDMGIVEPDTLVQTSPGKLTIGDRTIGDTHNNGLITVSQVVSKSSNIGTSKIALEMNAETLWDMYNDLGFGVSPKVGFPGAASGRLRPAKSWRPIEQATISYGHGISVSLMQLVRAYTALARNGDVIDLTFKRTHQEAQGHQIFRPEVARQMRAMMAQTVGAGGTARRVSVQGYTVAGKTGTANKIENGEYVNKYVSSFVGMAPAGQPRIIVAVMIDEPSRGSYYGGTVSAPVFNEVTTGALRLIGVHPDAAGFGVTPGILVRGIRN
ncbi:MAG: penicillin-binding protein 2, partial [Sutterellaceae bacterium]|nr:penicillin-binding protein 2 [Sutterellaceae bacterium]